MLVVAGVVAIGGGIAALARTLRMPDLSPLRDARRCAIADAPDATNVRIEGTVEALGETLPAPLSRERCVYYEHLVSTLGAGQGAEVHRAAHHVPFIVRDASGYAIVDAAGATVQVTRHERREDGGRPIADTLDPVSGRGRLRHFEALIRPGDRVAVIGRGVREPDPDARHTQASYRDGPATRLRLNHSPQFPLHVIDADRTI